MAALYTIQLHDIHLTDVWLQQKGGFSQQHGEDKVHMRTSAESDKDFMNHLLEVHTKFCIKPSCRNVIDSTTFQKDPNQFSHTNLVHESTPSQNVPVYAHNSESIKRENSLDDPSTHMEIQHIDYQQSAAVLSDTNSAIDPTPPHPCKSKIRQTISADKKTSALTSNKSKDTIYYGHHDHFMTEDAPGSLSDESCETIVEKSTDSHSEDIQGADPDTHMIYVKQEPDSPDRSHDQESYMLVEVKSEQNVFSKGHVEDLQGADPGAHMIYVKQEPESPDRSHDQESYVLVDVISEENVEHPGKERECGQQPLLARVLGNKSEHLTTMKSEVLEKKKDIDKLLLKEDAQFISHMMGEVEEIHSEKSQSSKADKTSVRSTSDQAGQKLYKCQFCFKAFTQKSVSKRHLKTHTGEKPFQCKLCPMAFAREYSLKCHMQTHNGEKPYKCHMCFRAFTGKVDLQRHLRTHTGEKPYKCQICSKAFTQKSVFTRHLKIHTGEKPFQCKLCPMAFARGYSLKCHMQTHNEQKPYKCHICLRAFTGKVDLQRHLRTHTGEKPYKCHMCSKAFTQKVSLQMHWRTHTGEKPYKCQICCKTFTQKGNLQKHMKNH